MSKKPSAETQLKALRQKYNRLVDDCARNLREANSLRDELVRTHEKLQTCNAERRQLLDAMCAQAKRESTSVAPPARGIKTGRFTFTGQNKIAAIRDLRSADNNLFLAQAKDIVEGALCKLSANEIEALKPHGYFTESQP